MLGEKTSDIFVELNKKINPYIYCGESIYDRQPLLGICTYLYPFGLFG